MTLEKALSVAGQTVGATAIVLFILFFTPVGGIIKALLLFGGPIGAVVLVFKAIFNSESLRESGIKLTCAVALLGLTVGAVLVLPNPPRSPDSHELREYRSR